MKCDRIADDACSAGSGAMTGAIAGIEQDLVMPLGVV